MARYVYQAQVKDGMGRILSGATVSVFLTGTTTPANFYVAKTGGTHVTATATDATGYFSCWFDDADYANTQAFDIVVSLTGYSSITYTQIYPSGWDKLWDDAGTYISPNNFSGLKIYDSGYLAIGTQAFFYDSGYSTLTVADAVRSYSLFNKVPTATHSGVMESAVSIMYNPTGSGVGSDPDESPTAQASADFAAYFANIKKNWDNNPVNGQIDGIEVITRNGGQSDGSAYLANMVINSVLGGDSAYKSYGSLFEGDIQLVRDNVVGTIVKEMAFVLGGITDFSGSHGTYSGVGASITSKAGVNNIGFQVWGYGSAANKFLTGFYCEDYIDVCFQGSGTHVTGLYLNGTFSGSALTLTGTFGNGGISMYNATITGPAILIPNDKSVFWQNAAGTTILNMLYLSSSDTLDLGTDLASGKLRVNIDGSMKTLSIDGSGFVKAA